ncbi:MAG: class I adenylate-forming enzyme family protein [Polyangiales bacterium]
MSLLQRVRALGEVVRDSGVLGHLNARGAVTLARRVAKRAMPKGPTAILALHAAHRPSDEALIDGDVRLDFQSLDDRVERLARAMMGRGVRRGDRVGVMMQNGHRYLLAQWAAMRVGAAVVQIGYRLKAQEIAHILDNAEPVMLFHDEAHRDVVAEAIAISKSKVQPIETPTGFDALLHGPIDERLTPEGDAQSATVMVYTSGTTGRPKGAPRTFEKTMHDSVIDFVRQIPARSTDRHLVTCPLYHSAPPAFVAFTYMFGGTVVINGHFDPEETLRMIARERINSTFMVPTMLTRLAALPEEVRRKYDTSSLRWILSGAAPLPTETARRIESWLGPILYNFYGSTETGLVTLALPGEHTARPGTIGRALLGNEIKLLGEDGREVRTGEVGELYAKNSMLVAGYHRDGDATRKAMRDGFFSVGDMARVDRDGYYFLAERKSDMVISGGVNIYPLEIEQRLHDHPEILEASVVGVPDPEWGESLRAFVVRRSGSDLGAEAVQRWVKDSLADYKMPRSVVFLDALPRNPTGKVLKRELRSM